MKNNLVLFAAIALITCSCHVNKSGTTSRSVETGTSTNNSTVADELLPARMQIRAAIKTGDSVLLKFTVFNNTDAVRKFCKWHTPFEPLMSEYLEIKNEAGVTMSYQGPMAKRVMPPPESSYLTIQPKDSVSASLDLVKAYAINTPGKYTITYTAGHMSNVAVKESVSFVYLK